MARSIVNIHSSGSALDTEITHVVDSQFKKIDNVHRATIWLESGEINRVDLELIGPVVSVEASVDSVTMTCPICDHSNTHKCEPK